MADELAIPDFLRVPAAVRAAAWRRHPPKAMPKFSEARKAEDPATRAVRREMAALERNKSEQQKRDERIARLSRRYGRGA